jgi:excisionase family DNA binding protein
MVKHKRPAINREAIDPNGAYSVTQVAELLEYHPGSVKRWLADGRVEGFRPNGFEWRIPGAEVKRLLDAKEYTGRLALHRPTASERGHVRIIEVDEETARHIGLLPRLRGDQGYNPLLPGWHQRWMRNLRDELERIEPA